MFLCSETFSSLLLKMGLWRFSQSETFRATLYRCSDLKLHLPAMPPARKETRHPCFCRCTPTSGTVLGLANWGDCSHIRGLEGMLQLEMTTATCWTLHLESTAWICPGPGIVAIAWILERIMGVSQSCWLFFCRFGEDWQPFWGTVSMNNCKTG